LDSRRRTTISQELEPLDFISSGIYWFFYFLKSPLCFPFALPGFQICLDQVLVRWIFIFHVATYAFLECLVRILPRFLISHLIRILSLLLLQNCIKIMICLRSGPSPEPFPLFFQILWILYLFLVFKSEIQSNFQSWALNFIRFFIVCNFAESYIVLLSFIYLLIFFFFNLCSLGENLELVEEERRESERKLWKVSNCLAVFDYLLRLNCSMVLLFLPRGWNWKLLLFSVTKETVLFCFNYFCWF
jgi:hypothetical protein